MMDANRNMIHGINVIHNYMEVTKPLLEGVAIPSQYIQELLTSMSGYVEECNKFLHAGGESQQPTNI